MILESIIAFGCGLVGSVVVNLLIGTYRGRR